MRNIKFRVWDGVDYMSEPFTLQKLMRGEIEFTSECHVMQYTGLKDKNGKEIYEGDVIQCGKIIGQVAYHTERALFILNDIRKFNVALYEYIPNAEIIGNIYEHPHLLNSDKNVQESDTTKAK